MLTEAFKFNSKISYPVKTFNYATAERQNITQLLMNPTIYIHSQASFKTKFIDIFEKYVLPYIVGDAIVSNWNSTPMKFYQNQLNFAIWCATTGCGISVRDHLLSSNKMIQSFYLFHVYFQTRKILNQLRCALPTEPSWNALDNSIDMTAFERFCNEFGVSQHSDFRHKVSANNGIGIVYNYATHLGYRPVNSPYNSKTMSFTTRTTNEILHIDYIAQGVEAGDGFVYLMLDHSKGFTRAGVERINESVRAFVWAILGSQGQTRTSITVVGPGFDAIKQCLSNIEDMISHEQDLPKSIKNYQDVLHYARSKVDFVLGEALYMVPSNMDLKVGQIANYNNEIIVANGEMVLGTNEDVNLKITLKAVVPNTVKEIIPNTEKKIIPTPVPQSSGNHEQNKIMLVVGAAGMGLGYYYLF